MQGNIIGQSGMFVNDSLFPIYQQLNQPIEYNGIWIKTEDNLKDVYFQTDDVREYEEVNDLPYDINFGCVTSIGLEIYIFGGSRGNEFANNAYKYNTVEKTYTKLADIPSIDGIESGSIAVIDNEVYIAYNPGTDYGYAYIEKYNPFSDEYTTILTNGPYAFEGGSMTAVKGDLYLFGSSASDYRKRAYKYSITDNELTGLRDMPSGLSGGSVVGINKNEICLFGVYVSTLYDIYLYKYNITENNYYEGSPIISGASSCATINKAVYLLMKDKLVTKYNMENDSLYQYGEKYEEDIDHIVNIKSDLYVLSQSKLYKFKLAVNYKGDGIYVISQTTSLSKDLDVSNILDVKKIVNGEEQDILVYVGDGESWKLLNGTDITQNTNALQYALSFKEEN